MIVASPLLTGVSPAANLLQILAPASVDLRIRKAFVGTSTSSTAQQAVLGWYRCATLFTGTEVLVEADEAGSFEFPTAPGTTPLCVRAPTGGTLEATPVWRKASGLTLEGWEYKGALLVPKGGAVVLRLDTALSGATDLLVLVEIDPV